MVDEYINGGRFDEVYNRIRNQIDSLVKEDPTAFYTYDEYDNAANILYKAIKLRDKSIKGQLDGTIPSTDEGQRENSSYLIDASGIDIKAMGQFDMGFSSKKDDEKSESQEGSSFFPGGSGFPFGDMPSFGSFTPGEGDSMFSFLGGSFSGNSLMSKTTNIIYFAICFLIMLLAVLSLKLFRRKKYSKS